MRSGEVRNARGKAGYAAASAGVAYSAPIASSTSGVTWSAESRMRGMPIEISVVLLGQASKWDRVRTVAREAGGDEVAGARGDGADEGEAVCAGGFDWGDG